MNQYNPVPGKDIRVILDRDVNRFVIQQERKRYANGSTNPNDLGSILDYQETGWEKRYETNDVGRLLQEVYSIAYHEDVVIRSIDLGSISLLSVPVVRALQQLSLLTF